MPRYIDADKLIDKIFPIGLIDDGNYTINAKAVKVAIDKMPTADVVPKSEVNKWVRECEELQGWLIELEKEVVTEIFEEIDNKLHDMAVEYHNAGHPEYFAVCEVVHHKVIRQVEKKYTEGEKEK